MKIGKLDLKAIPWPNDRHWVTIGIFALIIYMLQMAKTNSDLWANATFTDILKTIVITGLLNMILAFHFSANKSDETRSQNTGKAFDTITEVAKQAGNAPAAPDVMLKPGETAQAEESKNG